MTLEKIMANETNRRVSWYIWAKDEEQRKRIFADYMTYVKANCPSYGEQLIYRDMFLDKIEYIKERGKREFIQ